MQWMRQTAFVRAPLTIQIICCRVCRQLSIILSKKLRDVLILSVLPCRKAMILSPITAMSCPEVFLLRQRSLYRKKSSSNSAYSGCMRLMSCCAAMQVSPA